MQEGSLDVGLHMCLANLLHKLQRQGITCMYLWVSLIPLKPSDMGSELATVPLLAGTELLPTPSAPHTEARPSGVAHQVHLQ